MEVLVAAGVLVAGIVALLQLFLIAMRATVEARDATYATVLAAQKMEELRAAPYADAGGDTEYLDASGERVASGSAGAVYERRWAVEPLAIGPGVSVVITVRAWRRGASHRAVRLATFRARRGE